MLDRDAFTTEIGQLAERFNRTVSNDMARRYYRALKSMDTDAFMSAATLIYNSDTFWPPPNRFMEAAGLDAKTLAETAWQTALEEASSGTARPYSDYPPAHATALRAVGGNTVIGRTNQDRLSFLKRDFIQAFRAHHERSTNPVLDTPEPVEIAGLA